MDFDQILDQAIEMLQRRGRLSYRALKRQFDLDNEALENLTDELLFSQLVVEEGGKGLLWTGGSMARAGDESILFAQLRAVSNWLRVERRATYRELKYIFGLDDKRLEDIRKELTFKRLVVDEGGEGLVWIGEAPSGLQPGTTVPSEQNLVAPNTISLSPPALQPHVTTTNNLVIPSEDTLLEPLRDDQTIAPEPMRSSPEAERRQLTVMFCDLADSTPLSQRLDPEDLREVVCAYQETAAEIIQQYGGHMAQYLGDGLLVYFGWPLAHEDDAQRALHSGLAIVEAITSLLNLRLEQAHGVQLAVRIGIHTGPVVIGEMGGGERHENLAMGETVNVAARLESLAAHNTVAISNVTARLVEGVFELCDLGAQSLKGVAEPVSVFRVDGVREVDAEDSAAGGFEVLVGRDEEIGLLLRRWEQSKEGLGQVVLISGEAGVGKFSLVEGLRQYVRQEGNTLITFRCSEYVQHSPLYPVIAHVQRVLDWQRGDSVEARLAKLEQVLGSSNLPLKETVPLVAALLSLSLPEDRYPALNLTPQQQRQQTLDALVAWLMEETERQPVLAVWEHLHWADPSTLALLGLIIEQTPTVPMLHVLTYRPEFEAPWPMRSHMTPMMIHRLERSQVEALITHLAGGKTLPEEVVAHIVTKTDGVPLYVAELTKMLLDSALLQEAAEQYTLTGPLEASAIPATLQDSLMARLDRLPNVREVAQLGAVLGREFAYEMLQSLSVVEEPALKEGLKQLVDSEILYQRGRPPRATYTFRQTLMRDTAYLSLLRRTRQHYHQQVAQLLEARFPEVVETQPELVAHHYTEAALVDPAIDYWQRAGQRASERSAYAEAIAHLRQGLELLGALPDAPARFQQELDMQMALGPALMATEGHASSAVEQVYNRARKLCQHLPDTPEQFFVMWGLWRFYYNRVEYQTARELGEQLLELAQQTNDPSHLLAAHAALGTVLCQSGAFADAQTYLEPRIALTDLEEQRKQAVRYGVAPGAQCLAFAAWTLWSLGYPDQARQRSYEAYTLAQELAHPPSLALTLFYVARAHMQRREAAAAQEQAEACIAQATEQGLPHWEALGMIMRGWALASQGQGEEGMVQLQQGLKDALTREIESVRITALVALSQAYGALGQVDEGLGLVDEALTCADESDQCHSEAELYRLKGELLLQQPTLDGSQAEACFHQALDIARHQQARSWELRAATSMAKLWQFQGKHQEACDLLAPVYGWFTEGFDTVDLKEAKALLETLGHSSHASA